MSCASAVPTKPHRPCRRNPRRATVVQMLESHEGHSCLQVCLLNSKGSCFYEYSRGVLCCEAVVAVAEKRTKRHRDTSDRRARQAEAAMWEAALKRLRVN